MFGLLLPLILSRFGIVGLIILGLGYCALTSLGGGGGGICSAAAAARRRRRRANRR